MKKFIIRGQFIKTLEKSVFIAFILSILLPMFCFVNNCESLSKKVIRLHILANSDSIEDQAIKLSVRDKILESSEMLLNRNLCTFEMASQVLDKKIKEIEYIAQNEVYRLGYKQNVKAEITDMYFNTREYSNFTMPSGRYKALRITIGDGKGKNWWCVMFPPMCISPAEEHVNLDDVLSETEMDVLAEEYEIKFKIVEYFEYVKNLIFSWLGIYNV